MFDEYLSTVRSIVYYRSYRGSEARFFANGRHLELEQHTVDLTSDLPM